MTRDPRKEIMDKAALVFAAQGFKATTMQTLINNTRLSRANIRCYFDSRESLYQAILAEHFIPAREIVKAIELTPEQTALRRIMRYAQEVMHIKCRQPFFLPLWLSELLHPSTFGNSLVKPYTRQLYQSLLAALYDGTASGEFTDDTPPYQTASLLVEILHAHYLTPLARTPSDNDHCTEYIHFLLLGMKRNPLLLTYHPYHRR